ncbi:hypothetical protein GGP41_000494 [Bipolaris sorokiniana]|uniref:Uncharacterized protein n=2 Tax=Cochliobolus sativus TaxID=45130 RepID=A0A8H6DXL8_COCSA|nr:uncharacterized protein COCSADRAFT_204080 [Bipolaris sorokiniana ND90Pr]EMD59012.1 hypothetical protein COCSADRAFT_204080 [Bipolaris sorokiniana ND90Pr]KAF5851732.1 hypothetical protein GGP41_000494 [Bipolaris sorokiniana]
MSHQTPKTNFLPLLPLEIHSQTKKISPSTNKMTQHGSEPRTETTPSSGHQDRNKTSPGLSHGAVDQGNEHPTATTAKETTSGITTEVNELLKTSSWPIPHAREYQKHAWHSSVLGMEAKVKDEWGFSSANVSRSHTPNPVC